MPRSAVPHVLIERSLPRSCCNVTLSFFAHFAVKTQSPSITIMLSWLRRESSGPGGRRGQSTGCCGGYIDHRVDSMARRGAGIAQWLERRTRD